MYYRIALNLWGSKFSRTAIFKDFVEIISRIRCTRALHAMCYKFSLKYFRIRLKIHEIKDPRKFSSIRYVHRICTLLLAKIKVAVLILDKKNWLVKFFICWGTTKPFPDYKGFCVLCGACFDMQNSWWCHWRWYGWIPPLVPSLSKYCLATLE